MPNSKLGYIVQHENGSLVSDHFGVVIVFLDFNAAIKYMVSGSRTVLCMPFAKPRKKKVDDPT